MHVEMYKWAGGAMGEDHPLSAGKGLILVFPSEPVVDMCKLFGVWNSEAVNGFHEVLTQC